MTISPELEVLDQLLGGPKPLAVIRRVFESDDHFRRALLAMLYAGDIRLLRDERTEVRSWEWQSMLSDPRQWSDHRLSLTDQGLHRIGG